MLCSGRILLFLYGHASVLCLKMGNYVIQFRNTQSSVLFCIMVDTKEGEKVKLIHCADVHLHSRLNTHLSVQQSKERNGELVSSFVNMVEYGHRHGVSAVLIAG